MRRRRSEHTLPGDVMNYYSLVRYLPDPVTGEQVNVAAIIFDAEHVELRTTHNWKRIQRFGGENIAFIQDFIKAFNERYNKDATAKESDLMAEIQEMASNWCHSLQVSEPRPSTEGIVELADFVSERFLDPGDVAKAEKETTQRVRRTTQKGAAGLTARSIKQSVADRFGSSVGKSLVQRDYPVRGTLQQHISDIAVANGKPLYLAKAVSFEVQENKNLLDHIDATKWFLDDVRTRDQDTPIAIVVIPSLEQSTLYERSIRIFEELSGEVVGSTNLDSWARSMAETIPESVIRDLVA